MKLRPIFFALLVIAFGSTGCIFSPDDSGDGGGPEPDPHVFADTADKLINNFKRYYAEMNLDRYRELLHDNYLFVSQSEEGNYDLNTELEIANRMFNQVAGEGGIQIQDITVDVMQPIGPRWETTDPADPNFGGSLKRAYEVTISFIILNANTTYEATGMVIFYVAPIEVEQDDGSTREMYQLLGQHDQTFGGDAKSFSTPSASGAGVPIELSATAE